MFWLNKQKGKESEEETHTFSEKLWQIFANEKSFESWESGLQRRGQHPSCWRQALADPGHCELWGQQRPQPSASFCVQSWEGTACHYGLKYTGANMGSCSALSSGFIALCNDGKTRRAVAVSHIHTCATSGQLKSSPTEVLKATGWYPVGSLHQVVNNLYPSAKVGTQHIVADMQQDWCKAWRWEPQYHKRGVCEGHHCLH